MGRNKVPPRKQLIIRVPEDLYLEMVLWNPQLQGDVSFLRYGAINQHINGLIRRDVESRKEVQRGRLTAPVTPTGI